MQLDNLHTFIQTIVELADRHAEALRKSERLTQYALIDPLLRGLGWDTRNPDEVIPSVLLGEGG
jgi:predicted type IV restriction endonuclease